MVLTITTITPIATPPTIAEFCSISSIIFWKHPSKYIPLLDIGSQWPYKMSRMGVSAHGLREMIYLIRYYNNFIRGFGAIVRI